MNRLLTLLRLLIAAAMLTGTAGAVSVGISNSFSPAGITAGGVLTYSFSVANNGTDPLTGVGLQHAVSGITSFSDSTFESSCGGALTSSGNTLTWAGGSLPSSGAVCTITVKGVASTTTGIYTTIIPIAAIKTDQGLTNDISKEASLEVKSLALMVLGFIKTDAVGKTNPNPWYITGFPTTQTASVTINNPNTTQLSMQGATLTVPALMINPRLAVGSPCTLAINTTPVVSGSSSAYTINSMTLPVTTTCKLLFDVPPSIPLYTGNPEDAIGQPFTTPNPDLRLFTGTVPENSALSNTYAPLPLSNGGTGSQISAPPPVQIIKGFNKVDDASVSSAMTAVFTVDFRLRNNTSATRQVSLSDRIFSADLGSGMTFGAIAVRTNSLYASQNFVCNIQGVSTDAATQTIKFDKVALESGSDCTYSVTVSVNAGVITGTTRNTIMHGDISTDLLPNNPLTIPATSATITFLNEGTYGKTTLKEFPQYNQAFYTVTVQNDTATTMTGLSFTDTWSHGLRTDIAASYTTCAGGQLNLPVDGKGLVFSNGTLDPGKTCKVVIGIDKTSVLIQSPLAQQYYANVTPQLTSTSGHTFKKTTDQVEFQVLPSEFRLNNSRLTFSQNTVHEVALIYRNYAMKPHVREFNVTISDGQRFLEQPIETTCGGSIPWNQVTVIGKTASFTLNIPSASTTGSPVDKLVYSYKECSARVMIQGTVPGQNVKVTATTAEFQDGLVNAPSSTVGFDYVGERKYTFNKSFSSTPNTFTTPPTALYAGQILYMFVSTPKLSDPSAVPTAETFRIVDKLPEGMQVNLPGVLRWDDGSYGLGGVSSNPPTRTCDLDPKNLDPLQGIGRICIALRNDQGWYTVDGKTIVIYINTNNPNNIVIIPIRLMGSGNLTNVIQGSDTTALMGSVASLSTSDGTPSGTAASANLNVLPSVVVDKSFAPSTIFADGKTMLNLTITNSTPAADTITITDVFPDGLAPVMPLSVTGCPGSATYDPLTRNLVINGISLNKNASCTAQVEVIATSTITSKTTYTNTIPVGGATTTNGQNFQESTAKLTVNPVNVCAVISPTTTMQATLKSPGTTTVTFTFKNTGLQAWTGSNLTFSAALPGTYTALYSFDGAASNADIQQAWQARITKSGGLARGLSTKLTVTYTSASTLKRDEQQTASVTFTPTGNACKFVQGATTLTIIKGEPGTQKTQSTCTLNAAGEPQNCTPMSADALKVKPCSLLNYQLTLGNTGNASVLGTRLRDPVNANLTIVHTSARTSPATTPAATVLYSADGGTTWLKEPPASYANNTVVVALDTNGDGTITGKDTLEPGQTLTLNIYTLTGTVSGGCTAPTSFPAY
ncbi:hypothetical protein [Deinococcus sp.]|uniref:DUF7933 domain-containing protein n=1 Tax=Deinococcus sp. TaxID=47478 RepID=UPI0025C4B538|nr:hypothetical protein [Deinococcus sp.]